MLAAGPLMGPKMTSLPPFSPEQKPSNSLGSGSLREES
jgi:hypothetical protein